MDTDRYSFINANSIISSTFEKELVTAVEQIPKRILAPFCRVQEKNHEWDANMARDDFEDYLSPNEEIYYKISPFYLKNTDEVSIMFQGVGYGDFMVCMGRDLRAISRECKSIQDNEAQWFNISYPCSSELDSVQCRSLHFFVNLESSDLKCSGKKENFS